MGRTPSDRTPTHGPRGAAEFVVRTLRDRGHTAYFAGGCVRDELLGLTPQDYDVATDARPDAVVGLFDRTHTVGAAFAVVLVRVGRERIEVATFRRDGEYEDARRPNSVEFSSPEEDAARRDFTMNALFLDPLEEATDPQSRGASGRVIDHVGGLDDLRAGVVRAVGDPNERLAEDHLRALRAVRFAARFGFELDAGTGEAIRTHAASLRGVSRERLGHEMRRMAEHPGAGLAARLCEGLGLAASVLGEGVGSPEGIAEPVERLVARERDIGAPVVFAAWALARAGGASAALEQLGFAEGTTSIWRRVLMLSNDESTEMREVLTAARRFLVEWDGSRVALKKRWAAGGHARAGMAVLASFEPDAAGRVEREISELERDGVGLAPGPFVDGDALVAAGYPPGRVFGRILSDVYDEQLEGMLRDQAEAIRRAGELFRSAGIEPMR